MFSSEYIEIAIGLVFIFLLMGMATSTVHEWIAGKLKWRSDNLEKAIRSMLQNDGMYDAFKIHPLIKSLSNPDASESRLTGLAKRFGIRTGDPDLSSYIPSKNFALTVYDIITTAGTEQSIISNHLVKFQNKIDDLNLEDEVKKIVKKELGSLSNKILIDRNVNEETLTQLKSLIHNFFPEEDLTEMTQAITERGANKLGIGELKHALDNLTGEAATGIADIEKRIVTGRENVEKWFNDTMDRSSGWYKRNATKVMFIIGVILAVLFNVDALHLGKALYTQPALRAAVYAEAERFGDSQENNPIVPSGNLDEVKKNVDKMLALNLPIGWSEKPVQDMIDAGLGDFFSSIVGWIITGAAAAQGGQYWYDILMKLINVRSAGKKPEVDPKPNTQTATT